MVRPDAIAVRPLGSRAVLPPDAVAALFGAGAVLRETARATLVQRGRDVGQVSVVAGPALAVVLDGAAEVEGPVRLLGPVGAVGPVAPARVRSRLVLPDGLRRAWNVPDRATLGLGAVALAVEVASGPDPEAQVDRALWLGAGRPETARWLAGVALDEPEPEAPADHGALTVGRRVVTETDVRQARMRRQRIRLGPGQIVTPAARSLAAEWDVFEAADGAEPPGRTRRR